MPLKSLWTIAVLLFWSACNFCDVSARTVTKFESIKQSEIKAKQILFPNFPKAYNPSLIQTDYGLLLVFRYIPDITQLAHSTIGAVLLNSDLEPLNEPQILNTRNAGDSTPSYAEDARLFQFQGNTYVIYNDNLDVKENEAPIERSLFIAKLNYENEVFWLDRPLKLYHAEHHRSRRIEKNWSPFQWQDHLLISYTLSPHEVLKVDLETGCCTPVYHTKSGYAWEWGTLRGGSAAQIINNEYVAFFHTRTRTASQISQFNAIPHYIGGVYTFNTEPPFNLKRVTNTPLIHDMFYSKEDNWIRIFYPAGFALVDGMVHLAYGIDDKEMWIAQIPWTQIEDCLLPIQNQ